MTFAAIFCIIERIMEERVLLSRSYLETLAIDELVRLGDDFGVDIPPALNRRLIIGELLEMQEDFRSNAAALSDSAEGDDEDTEMPANSYNETRVSILLRNPGWLFAFWDFSAAEFSACAQRRGFESFGLRISFFDDASLAAPRDAFTTAVSPADRKLYIHTHEQGCLCRADLVAMNRHERDFVLAHSNVIAVPPAAGIDLHKSESDGTPPLLLLSGIEELKRKYRRCHRQSFL